MIIVQVMRHIRALIQQKNGKRKDVRVFDDPDFAAWSHKWEVSFRDPPKRLTKDQLLLVYASITCDSDAKALSDGDGYDWNATVRLTDTVYRSSSGVERDLLLSFNCTIATLNLATNVQLDVLDGSEWPMVQRCRESGQDCTRNAARWLKNELNADLVALQEGPCVSRFGEELGDEYNVFINGHVGIVVKRDLRAHILKPRYEKGYGIRGAIACYLPRFRTLFVSVWLDHKHDKKRAFEHVGRALAKDEVAQNCARVLVGTDSNDYQGRLVGEPIEMPVNEACTTVQNVTPELVTCCEDSNYQYYGDYIFDSCPENTKSVDAGPAGTEQLMSDHMAVYARVALALPGDC